MAGTASVRCTGCGAELSAAARFCSICGRDRNASVPPGTATNLGGGVPTQNAPALSSMPYIPAAPPTPPRRESNDNAKIIGASIAGLLLIAAAGYFFANAAGLLNANRTAVEPSGVLNAPPTQTAPAPILNVPPTRAPQTPVLTPPKTVGNPMPEDVIAYLRWLKKFEIARQDLSNRSAAVAATAFVKLQKSALDKALDMSNPENEAPKPRPENNFLPDLNQQVQQWNGAAGLFQQRIPPNPCAGLATSYGRALNVSVAKTIKLLNLIATIPEKSESDPGALMQMLTEMKTEAGSRTMSGEVDASYASADASLNELRDRYTDIPADISRAQFSIQEESRGSVPTPTIPGFGM